MFIIRCFVAAVLFFCQPGSASFVLGVQEDSDPSSKTSPIKYLPAKAYYVLPETHNNQSGYFSLSEGLDGNMHIGTTSYGDNAYLVEFDPVTETQRVVLDTNKVCGLSTKGYAAQAKLHTRNYVGPSGIVYVGSKQGYRMDESDQSEYPGGYVMSYDPRNGHTRNLGMPFPGQGVADIMVDENRGLTYVVTCEDQHWMLGGLAGEAYRELGPILTPYAMTLIAADGKAYAITEDFQLASYDPQSGRVAIRPIMVNQKRWTRTNSHSIPTWVLSADKKRAYLILLNDPTLLEIDLVNGRPTISHGKMIDGKNPDSRCGLDLGADGKLYAVIRINNETGFGKGFLHHLTRFDPRTKKMEDLGVITVRNPDYFDWDKKDAKGKPQKWIHGFHRLPDDTLTPMHAHMSLKATRDNTIYVTIIYPFTLLKIDQFKTHKKQGVAERYCDWAESVTIRAEQNIAKFTEVAEVVAERHIKGGLIGFPMIQQALAQDLWGRSGGMMHIGFNRPWKKNRSDAEKAHDIAIVGYESAPGEKDLEKLLELKERGVYLIGFGPKKLNSLAKIRQQCDAWFDSGLGAVDRVVELDSKRRADRGNVTANAIHGGTLIAEIVAALSRQGKMPTMWKGYAYEDGRAWGERYFRKTQFHDDFDVKPIRAGELGVRFLTQIRYPIRRIKSQGDELRKAAATIHSEIKSGKKIYVAWQGHMPPKYIGLGDDREWAKAIEFHPFLESQVKSFKAQVPAGGLVLSLGYHGLDPIQARTWSDKNNRVIHLSGDHPDKNWRNYGELNQHIDLGFAFGDACVSIDHYPLKLFAPSGITQSLAYQAIQCEINK